MAQTKGKTVERYIAHDGQTIWGIGNTMVEALDDASLYLDHDDQTLNELLVHQCTEALYNTVREHGGENIEYSYDRNPYTVCDLD